jgi:hypothetical protein
VKELGKKDREKITPRLIYLILPTLDTLPPITITTQIPFSITETNTKFGKEKNHYHPLSYAYYICHTLFSNKEVRRGRLTTWQSHP